MNPRALMPLLTLGCGAIDLHEQVTNLLPIAHEVLPREVFLERYGRPCRVEPQGVGERWFYCVKACPCNEDQTEGGLILCQPGCTERAALAGYDVASWEP